MPPGTRGCLVWSIAPMEKSCHMKLVFPKEIHQRLCSFVDKEGVFSGKAYAVSLNDYPDKEFIDPDTTYFAQGTSADIMQFDGESNTVKLRYFQVQSPIAKA